MKSLLEKIRITISTVGLVGIFLTLFPSHAAAQFNQLKRWDGTTPGFGYFVHTLSDSGGNPSNRRQDGIPDIIIGKSCLDINCLASDGAVSVYSGKDHSLIFQINGTAWSYAVDAGDLNGDGVPDIFVGEMGFNVPGKASAYSGVDGSPIPNLEFSTSGPYEGFGVCVSGIGDITGDGIPDLLVGAEGGNYVVLFSGADGSLIKRIDGPPSSSFGISVSEAGDVNGDGTPDFIVGAQFASPNGKSDAGSAFVFSGRIDQNFPLIYEFDGENAGDRMGGCCGSVDSVGDLNGDGKTELAVTAFGASPNGLSGAGSIYIFDGATGAPFQRFDGLGPMRFDGENAGDLLGGDPSFCGCGWVAKVGDINGDGYPDFMAGAPSANFGAGRVLIFSGYDASVLFRIDNPDPGFNPPHFGVGGASLGDINGDGRPEILIGAGRVQGPEIGSAYLFSNVPLPNLVMGVVYTDTAFIAPGKTLSVLNSVFNLGEGSAGSFRIGFYLSVNADGSTRDVAVSATRALMSLGVGAFSTDSTTLTIPAATPLGTYYLCAEADSLNQVVETDETNNTLCTDSTMEVTLPDLIMALVNPGAPTVNQGGTLSVMTTVTNGGSASGAFRIAFRLSANGVYGDGDDVVISTVRVVSALGGGSSSTGTTGLLIPSSLPPGGYYVCAVADSLAQVVETDESNNTLCSSTQVTVPPPDLTLSSLSTSATTVAKGHSFSVGFTIKNQGGSKAGAFVTGFQLSATANYGGGVPISQTLSLSSLGVGASYSNGSFTLVVPSIAPPGTYYVCGMTDVNNTVIESDESNNTRCTTTTITVTP